MPKFLLLAVFVSAAVPSVADERPNIVFLFADDLGYADLGCYGHPYAETPRIDGLADEGTRFTQFYVTGVTCNPSRTGLMTGRHPARFPRYAADFGFADRVTVTELLNDAGYATGHFGKWHIGPEDSDGTYGIDRIETIGKPKDPSLGRDTDLYSAAIDFIKEHKDGPFYVNVWGHATHFPVNTHELLAGRFKDVVVDRGDFSATMQKKFDESLVLDEDLDDSMRQYLGDVYQIDVNVGRVLDTLDELGIAENTIVVFSSDHGPAPVKLAQGTRKYSENMLGYAGEFRGGKHSQLEGGVRVPCIVRWPGRVPAGRVDTTNIGSFIDWLPTLCTLAGVEDLPAGLDGEDISGVWLGGDSERTTPLFWKTSSKNGGPSMRDGDWKLHASLRRDRDGRATLSDLRLFNLAEDPAEGVDLAGDRPDVLERMRRQMEAWVAGLPADYEKASGGKEKKKNKTRARDRDA
ncbi:MAG: sulfatase-like hydrolase/transferase [Planctomycetota bacterium]